MELKNHRRTIPTMTPEIRKAFPFPIFQVGSFIRKLFAGETAEFGVIHIHPFASLTKRCF